MARKDLNGINGKMVRDTKRDEAPQKKNHTHKDCMSLSHKEKIVEKEE